VFGLAACGDANDSVATNDTGGISDALQDTIGDVSADTTTPDTGPDSDTSADTRDPDTLEETVSPLFSLKSDDRFIVPGNIAEKTSPAVAGALVAWVETTDLGPSLVVWDTRDLNQAPRSYTVPNLTRPRQLALSDVYMVYVDDRYGDPDVFALDLETGLERPVVTKFGAQERPDILGTVVAWEDCRDCVSGAEVPGREAQRQVYSRDLASGDETQLTTSPDGAFSPRFGLLVDGRQALAWVEGRAALAYTRLLPGQSGRFDVSASIPTDQEVASLELVAGILAWRPRPLIVNPDSMIVNPDSMWPSDLFATQVDGGDTTALTLHAELSGRLANAGTARTIDGLGDQLAWLESSPGDPRVGRFMVRELGAGLNDQRFALPEISGMALGSEYAVVTAPRADNDGLSDLHLFPLD
ncbi:MAG: hypothetical protein HS128_16000, partial [Ideonella sp.]|nr:hypothetical protein [Ideonella sp.]